MCKDMSWWGNNANQQPVLPAITMTTDASNTGWGGISDGVFTGGLWSKDEQSLHMNCLELKAVLLSIKAFISKKEKLPFTYCLIIPPVICVSNQGTTKRHLSYELCIGRNSWITASHLPGVDKIQADKKSRCLGLERGVLAAELCSGEARYDPFDIDLFASRINRKVQCYVSRYKDSEAWGTDAFSFSQSHLLAYFFLLSALHVFQEL